MADDSNQTSDLIKVQQKRQVSPQYKEKWHVSA